MAQGTRNVATELQKRTDINLIDRLLMINPTTLEPMYVEMSQVLDNLRNRIVPVFDFNDDRVITSVAPDGRLIKSNLLDKFTGELVTFRETDSITEFDGVLCVFHDGKYYLRDISRGIDARIFGAIGNDVADDTLAIKAMILAGAKFNKPTLFFPDTYVFKVTSKLTINYACNIVMDGQIKWYGGGDDICLDVYQSSGSMLYVKQSFNVVSNAVSNWTNENNIGVRLKALMFSDITIKNIQGFTIGVQAFAPGNDGFAWNKITIHEILNCSIRVDLFGTNTGWVNENIWDLAGRMGAVGTYSSRLVNIDIRIGGSGTYYHNGNTFNKAPFESGSSNYIPVVINRGRYNTFNNCRFEANFNNGLLAEINNDSDFNEFIVVNKPVTTPRLVDNSIRRNNYLFYRYLQANNHKNIIFNSGRLVEKTKIANGTRVNIKGIDCRDYMSTDVTAISPAYNGTRLRSDHIELTNNFEDIGVTIDATANKDFVFQVNLAQNTTCNTGFIPFDVNGDVVTSAGTVEGVLANNFYWAAGVNCWLRSTNTNGSPERVSFSSSVVKVRFVIRKGTGETRIKSFSIGSVNKLPNDRSAIVYSEASSPDFNISNIIPTAGIGKNSEIVMNTAFPASSNIFGWKCTSGGSPGTWQAIPFVQGAAAAPNTAFQASGANPSKAEFDNLLAELRQLKTVLRNANLLAT